MTDIVERLRQRGCDLRSHPVANGTIDCTEEAGELLCMAADEIKRLRAALDAVRAEERERCVRILCAYRVPVGNSAAGEMAAEWTMEALREIRDAIRATPSGETPP